MKNISFFWKLFLSVFVGILLSLASLIFAFRLTVPYAFNLHTSEMNMMMRNPNVQMGPGMMNTSLFDVFFRTFNEAIWIALPVALLISLLISLAISRVISNPLQKMFVAARDIASGKYHQRIPLSFVAEEKKLDPIQKLALGFNQMASSLEDTENMRQQLIGDISHELRTPLTTIKGSMEGLIDGVIPADEKTYQQIYGEADRLQRLVEDLQELSRIEGGAYHLEKRWFSLDDLIETIAHKYASRFEEKQISFSYNHPDTSIRIFADPDRLEQVLVNLLINAIHYSDEGGSVSLETHQTRDTLTIRVQDNGVGIAPEHLANVFTRFYRVDKSRSRQSGGSGIGLTISKHLVEAHGGTITVISPGLGLGSTFEIKLPVEDKKEKQG